MPGLCDLPDEVILLTFNCGILDPADFAAVARSCKRLKEVAEDALYALNRDRDASSAVDWAAKHGNLATLDKALKHGLRIDGLDGEGSSPDEEEPSPVNDFYPFQTAVEHGQDSAVAWFLDHGADLTRRISPRCRCRMTETCILHAAICSRHASTALILISRGAPLRYMSYGRGYLDDYCVTALLEASVFGLDTVVDVLVKDNGMKLQTRHEDQVQNALAWAAMFHGNVSMVRTLVDLGADVNWPHTEWDLSALHCAIRNGNFAIAHTLLDLGATIHSYEHELNSEDEEYGEMELETLEVEVTPLHDTLTSNWDSLTPTREVYDWSLGEKDPIDKWYVERACFMKRLIELGVDVNMKATGDWDGELQISTPMDLAITAAPENTLIQDVSTLIAAGAKVSSKLLQTAWETYWYRGDTEECMDIIKPLLKHGARLDELMHPGMSMLQVLARDCKTAGEHSGLHEVLLLSSPTSLSPEHLAEVLGDSLHDLDWYTSTVLIRHGGRVSGEDELLNIACTITDQSEFVSQDFDLDPEKASMFPEPRVSECMGFILDMGLSSEDQCLIFCRVLRKRRITLAHLFLNRGLASKPEATKYLVGYLMLAASWGNVCVIKRLWQQAYEHISQADRLLIVYNSIIRDKREAVSFFMDHGITPFDSLSLAESCEALRLRKNKAASYRDDLMAPKPHDLDKERVSAALAVTTRERSKIQLRSESIGTKLPDFLDSQYYMSPLQLAVRYGHMDIISDLLEYIPQNLDATIMFSEFHIPMVLKKANEIKEMIQKAVDLNSWSRQLRNK